VTESARGEGSRGIRRGRVASFDEPVGLGTIVDPDGIEFHFHCIEIADGSRTIPLGCEVEFDLLAKFGRWEAANIRGR
jgi:CspA family cold shock protein